MSKIILLISFFSSLAFAQKEIKVVEEKMKPFIFQIEKQLAEQVKSTLEESLKIKDVVARTKLTIDPLVVAKKYNLVPRKNKFILPGLDESAINVEENLKDFNPTIQDVYTAISELNIRISSLVVFSDTEKADIEKVITDDLMTLNLKKISYSFFKSKNLENVPEPVVIKDSLPATPLQTDSQDLVSTDRDWTFVGLGLIGVLLILSISLVGLMLLKQFKNMSNSLSGAISQIDFSPDMAQNQNRDNKNSLEVDTSLDKYSSRVQKLISEVKEKERFYKIYNSDFSALRFYVLCEILHLDDRIHLKKILTPAQSQAYLSFLKSVSNGLVEESRVIEAVKSLSRELSLYLHDEATFVEQSLRNKIKTLNVDSLKSLIEDSNEKDFMTLAQYSNPLELSHILNAYPNILDRFDTLEVRDISSEELNVLTQKIDRQEVGPPDIHSNFELKLREFVPVDIEMKLNQKLGMDKTLWEELDDDGILSLYDFTIDLAPKEASMFVSIIPEELRLDVLANIPDLKREQIKRYGFEVTRRSMELKHQFFQTLRS